MLLLRKMWDKVYRLKDSKTLFPGSIYIFCTSCGDNTFAPHFPRINDLKKEINYRLITKQFSKWYGLKLGLSSTCTAICDY